MPRYEATTGGLTVERKYSHGWDVTHAESGREAVGGLRQRRFAEQARAELLATGVDFTASIREIQRPATRKMWRDVYYRWQARSQATDIDPETYEYYPWSCRYGQVIPSAAQAADLRRSHAAGDGEAVIRMLKALR